MEYYAHSKEGCPPEEWQPLKEHLENVAELAAEFAKPFGGQEWAANAGWLHDLGKATNAFQSYLRRANELDDAAYGSDGSNSSHASAGAAWAVAHKGNVIGKLLAYLCTGHHAGLTDAQVGQPLWSLVWRRDAAT